MLCLSEDWVKVQIELVRHFVPPQVIRWYLGVAAAPKHSGAYGGLLLICQDHTPRPSCTQKIQPKHFFYEFFKHFFELKVKNKIRCDWFYENRTSKDQVSEGA